MAGKAPPPKEQCDADEVPRVRADVVEKARDANEKFECVWRFRHAIPAETNGWVYVGDGGALAASDYWVDQFGDGGADVGWTVNVDDRRAAVSFTADMDHKVDSKRRVYTVEPRGEEAGLVERKRMLWEAVQWLLEFMEENPPGNVDTDSFEEPL